MPLTQAAAIFARIARRAAAIVQQIFEGMRSTARALDPA